MNIDRLVTVAAGWDGRLDRWIVPALYEGASRSVDGRPVSLVAAQVLIYLLQSMVENSLRGT